MRQNKNVMIIFFFININFTSLSNNILIATGHKKMSQGPRAAGLVFDMPGLEETLNSSWFQFSFHRETVFTLYIQATYIKYILFYVYKARHV